MKKITLILTFLISAFSFAQEVSPFYPAKYTGTDSFYFTSQVTYYDLNFISNNISEFLLYRMNMGIDKTDDSKLLFNGGTYTVSYIDKASVSGLRKLNFTYSVGKVNEVYIIQSLKVTGSDERVIDFFITFWETALNFKEPKGKSDVSLLTGQDIVKLFFNKGNPYITIDNNTFKGLTEFKNHFEKLRASN